MKTLVKCNGLKYEAEKWNDDYDILDSTNCYIYALNIPKNPETEEKWDKWTSVQPGNLGGNKLDPETWQVKYDPEFINFFLNNVNNDLRELQLQIIPSTFEEIIEEEEVWKIALAFNSLDYHWYRQNDDGTWSHKLGRNFVSNIDSDYNVINNPEICNRGSYNKFVGFFMIKKLI